MLPCRQAFSSKLRIRSRLVPTDSRDRIITLSLGVVSCLKRGRAGLTRLVYEFLNRLFPSQFSSIFNESLFPVFLVSVSTAADEVFVLFVCDFILVDIKVVQLPRSVFPPYTRTMPGGILPFLSSTLTRS